MIGSAIEYLVSQGDKIGLGFLLLMLCVGCAAFSGWMELLARRLDCDSESQGQDGERSV